ncbi:MAG: glycoside hydrolase family 15 protein [Candidatus Dormibacteria bacterium]
MHIEDYALLSDCQGAALVSRSGSIDWLCLPRFDSSATFARLLDPLAGHWSIAPTERAETSRQYMRDTLVIRTVFDTDTGSIALTDALLLGDNEQGHNIGKHSRHALVRRIECLTGEVEMAMEFAPRPEYGLTTPRFTPTPGGVRSVGGEQSLALCADTPITIEPGGATAAFTLKPGQQTVFSLRTCSPWDPHPDPWSAAEAAQKLDDTIAAWRSWANLHQSYEGPYRDLVLHSGRVLQGLTYAPTGAIVAAPTTSLPETVGGSRNWDYRYCWVRDASLTMEALWVAACPDEAAEFFAFLGTAAGGGVSNTGLQIMYGVRGERLLPEHELDHLAGYQESRPVRIGNGAWNQDQLDVYGELSSAAQLLSEPIGTFDKSTATFLIDVADTAASRWHQPDQGIWEVRGPARHMVHSKAMCWVALDRAVQLAPKLGAGEKAAKWTETRDEIRDAILKRGWSESQHAFAQSFDSDELDASTLLLAIGGFLPPTDDRMRATIEAVAERLTDERGFVYRYRGEDGLDGHEGTFTICSFWLAQCLAMAGELTRATELFERIIAHANDVGLMSEEIGAQGEHVGNFPQAFTHVGLINAAWAIHLAKGLA